MDNQIYILGFEPPHEKERDVYEKMLPILREATESAGGDGDALTIKHGKNYSSIWFGSILAFRLCLRKSSYIEVPGDLKERIASAFISSKEKLVSGNFWRVYCDATNIINSAPALSEVMKATVDCTPKEWDCCSRYMECSDAQTCIHPDKKVALACGYRRILNTGKVFYGKNRNV